MEPSRPSNDPDHRFCTRCGYALDPLDTKCARCVRLDYAAQFAVMNLPAPRKRMSESLAWLVMAILAIGGMVAGTLYEQHLREVESAQGRPPTPLNLPPGSAGADGPRYSRSFPPRDSWQPPPSSPRSTAAPQPSTTETAPPSTGTRYPGAPLPPEPLPSPLPALRGRAHIGDASLHVVNDGHGQEEAAGRVLIVNDGPYELTDFRLSLTVVGSTYVLTPYEGSLDYPRTIIWRHISPGGSLDVPVTTGGVYSSYSASSMKTITLTATLDGPPGTVSDETTLY